MPLVILALLVAVPLAEVFVFAEVGGLVGAWPTVGLVVLTAALGLAMVRVQGMTVLERARRSMERDEPPVAEVVEGVGLLAAGALLLVPGFLTDAVGFVLLVPPARIALLRGLWAALKRRGAHVRTARDTVVEGEYEDVTPSDRGGPRLPPRGPGAG